MSTQTCGCDPEANHACERHAGTEVFAADLPHIKDSGARVTFESGMVRDIATDKTDYALIYDGPMFERWAAHLTAGAKKYEARNWMKGAEDPAARERARQSAFRHFVQWFRGDTDEDHAAAVYFNINQVENSKSTICCKST